jgi:putative Holliday junction resolvase
MWILRGQLSRFLYEGDMMIVQRIMGLDVGDRTIGVAVSDPLGLTAQGVETIHRTNIKQDISRISELIDKLNVEQILVGLPRSLNNTLGPQAEKVQRFVAQLEKKVSIPIVTVDERFSTAVAERSLLQGDVSRQKRKQVIDKLAAQIILQGHLDRMRRRQDG